ncbi:MAG TPA: BTAD domain-containing putative transcriptional regulator [Dongiaceae bacterium]|nr:BTAD domain-containing putative transcriptional regulator [Dongiaceae bacterium]
MDNYSDCISKINPPELSGIVVRPRVFAQLDRCCETKVAWVSGPAGSGKTTLVASYVESRRLPCVWYKTDDGDADPATFFFCLGRAFQKFLHFDTNPFPVLSSEYLNGIDAFAIRFFEQIVTFPEAPRVIVIDNYQEVPHAAELHPVLSKAFTKLPSGFTVIIVSRELPHARYIRLRANKLLAVLNPGSLKFTIEEAQEVINNLLPEFPAAMGALLHKHTGGWAAGLVLMVEHYRLMGGGGVVPAVRTPQEIFDYFASEIFEQAARDYSDFLLETAAFDEMTADMAKELTGRDDSGQILSMLNSKHCFTDMYLNGEPVYSYHPLFLEFLRSRAESSFGMDGFRSIKRTAAKVAEQHGWGDAASGLYLESGCWQGLTALLEQIAETVIAQGRSKTVIEWLDKVPPEELDKHPRLLYWLGISELSLAHCSKARARFEHALALSDNRHDADGVYLAWSAMIDSYFLEMMDWRPLDRLTHSFGDFRKRYPEIPSGATELRVALSGFTAHVLRQEDHEGINALRQRLDALLPKTGLSTQLQSGLIKSHHYIWIGDYHRNRLLLDELREDVRSATNPPPFQILTLKMLEAMHFCLTVEPDLSREAIKEGLALAASSGVDVWNKHYLSCAVEVALIDGNIGEARSLLRDMGHDLPQANTIAQFNYHLLRGWVNYLRDNTAMALSHLEMCHGPAMTIGSRFHEGVWCLAMSQVKLKRKADDEATDFLERALTISQSIRSKNLEFLSLLYRAQMRCESGDQDGALVALRSGLAIGRDQYYVHFIWWIPSIVADLCVLALQHGIETEYVRYLIRRRDLFPAVPPVDVEEWPWEVTIRCLGNIEVRVHGVMVKIQKKPLELLKAIIALGGYDVRSERIADLLWPDTEGDAGLGNFKITLHRLRQLLGENSIVLKDGKLSLSNRRVWLDVWAFERIVLRATAEWCKKTNHELTQKFTEQAMALYGGQFIKEDHEKEWLYRQREKLSRTFIAAVAFFGERCVLAGNFEKAITAYQKGVEMEPLAEVLYEGLIKTCFAAGYRANAIQAYRRYETALRENLGIQPSRSLAELLESAAL